MSRRSTVFIGVGVLLLVVSAYSLGGVVQAASLFVGARALRNANFWGSISLVAFLGSRICFWRGATKVWGRSSPRIFVGTAAAILAAALVWPLASEFMAVDACLDSGGSYDYVLSTCDLQRDHPHLQLFERQGFRVVGSLALMAFAALLVAPSWLGAGRRHKAL